MSRAYEASGRVRQKERTRAALVAAARDLIAGGVPAPTVGAAAAAADISRTTAYRYFPDQRSLLVAAHPEIDIVSLLDRDTEPDVESRFRAAVGAFTDLVVRTEDQQRTMLRLSLAASDQAPALPLRQGRAIGWFAEALSPLREEWGDEGILRLAVAVRSAIGIEALIWLTDVGGLSVPAAVEVMHWTAASLLQQALATGPPPRSRG
jgi:AcrR family transcriptional regulator